MDLSVINPSVLIVSLMIAATPILLAAIGELVVEKAGVLNLGVEGMMIIGAVTGYAVAINTGSPWMGFLGAALGGALISQVFGLLTQYLMTNQVATGLALTLFGIGLSALIGTEYLQLRPPPMDSLRIGARLDVIVIFSLVLVALVWAVLNHTRAGLILRAVGESHDAAHALGYRVVRVRLVAIAFGGACAGLGGAYLSLLRVSQWTEGMTAGAGWIALAIVVFGAWRPLRVTVGAYLFGGITILQLNLQAAGVAIPVEYLSMSPYLITILVLVIMSSGRARARLSAPKDLGRPFHASG